MLSAADLGSPAGTPTYIRTLAQGLWKHGADLHLVGVKKDPTRDIAPMGKGRFHPIDISNWKSRNGPQWAKLEVLPRLFRKAAKLHRHHAFDVLHAHHVEALSVALSLRAILRPRPSIVFHGHTLLHQELPLYARWLPGLGTLGAACDRVPRAADGVVALSRHEVAYYRRLGIPSERTLYLPPRLPDVRTQIPAEPKRWVYAGNTDPYQNISLLLQAFARYRTTVCDASLTLLLDPTVRWIDRLPGVAIVRVGRHEDLQAHLRHYDVAFSCRTNASGFPIKIVNYLEAGLPVISCVADHTALHRGIAHAKPEADAIVRAVPTLREQLSLDVSTVKIEVENALLGFYVSSRRARSRPPPG